MILSVRNGVLDQNRIQHNRCRTVALGISLAAINYGVTSWFSLVFTVSTYVSFLISFFWLIYVLIKCIEDKEYCIRLILTIFAIVGILTINYIVFPSTGEYYIKYARDLVRILFIYIPTAVAIYLVYDYDVLLMHSARIASKTSIILCTSYFIMPEHSSMAWGLRIMPLFVILNLYRYNNVGRRWYLIFWFTFAFSLLGSRQNIVLILLIMLCTDLLVKRDRKRFKVITIIIRYVLMALIVLLAWDYILDLLIKAIQLLNIDSKGLVSLANSELLDSSNRTKIYTISRYIIKQNGFALSGLFSDRMYLSYYLPGTWYPHNIYYELLISFGIMAGNVIAIVIVFLCFRFFRYSENNMLYFGIGLIAISLGRLMVSDSYLINGYFYILIGMLLGARRNYFIINSHNN